MTQAARRTLLHGGFEHHAGNAPDEIALVVGDECVTYRELDARANQLAQRLRHLGVEAGDRIALCASRDANLYAGLLGILKSGAAYVPLDPDIPVERQRFMIRDSASRGVVTSGIDSPGVAGYRVDLIVDAESMASLPASAPDPRPDPDSEAYVIYTSGTTGNPKGVPIRHRQVADRIATMSAIFGVEPGDRVLQFASVMFDASVEQIFTALNNGATLIARTDAWSVDSMLRLLEDEHITVAQFTPTVWAALTRRLVDTATSLPAALTRVILAGERIDPADMALWFTHCDIPLINVYGPTETTISATAHRFDRFEEPIVIGTPVAGVRANIMNAPGTPAAPGASGELWLSGPGTSDGYLGRPDLTAERFVTGPDGERAYRTGDLVRLTGTGTLEYLGRLDDQVKIGGVRIEPAEVAVTLAKHPEVAQAHVEVRRLQSQDCLVAHIIPQDHRQIPSARRLRAFLSEKLPAALIPSHFSVLERMPVLPNGKLDRAALAEVAIAPREFEGDYVAPVPGTEARLASYWAGELGMERVGAEDDLVSLGAHSLRTMRIAGQIAGSEGVDLTIGELRAASTVRAQAALVDQRRGHPRRFPTIRSSRHDRMPMSEQQKQLWFLARLDPSDASYRFQTVIRVSGILDLDVIDRVITELHRRHTILRTTYSEDIEGFWQHIHEPQLVSARRVNLRELPDAVRRAAADDAVRKAIAAPLDLAKLPLQEWTIVQTGDEQFDVVLLESHIVHDGWSFALLIREFTALYNAYHTGQPSPLPEPAISYGDYAAWQQRELGSAGMLTAQLDSWRQRLADLPDPVSFPSDYSRPPTIRHEGGVVRVDLPGSLPDRIRVFCREHDVTLFEMLLTAFYVLMFRHTQQNNLCIGSAFANRRLPETQHTLGMFVNTVLLQASIGARDAFEDVLSRVRREVQRADDAQEVPFPAIVHALNPERSATASPLTQVMFSAHDSAFPELNLGDASGTISYPSNGSAKQELNVIVLPAGESFSGRRDMTDQRITLEWEYNSMLFTRSTVESIGGRYVELLENVLTRPSRPVSDIPIIGRQEKRRLSDFSHSPAFGNRTSGNAAFLVPPRVADHIEAWASRSPATVAVRDDAGVLTYRELDHISSAVARELRRRGIEAGAVVGAVVERGRDLPIAAIAAHKSGAAYAPVDPAGSPERIAAMLDGASVVLCSESTVRRVRQGTAEPLLIGDACSSGRDLSTLLPTRSDRGELGCVIYTSGSTGTPEGVMIGQGNLSNLVEWSTAELPLPHGAVVPCVASQSSDASVWEMWRTFAAGATCLISPDRVRTSPDELVRWLREHRVKHCYLPAALGNQVLRHHREDLPDLTWLGVGGGRLQLPAGARLPFELSNLYGSAEVGVIGTMRSIPRGTEIGDDLATPPIGRPIAGAEALVVDGTGRQVPIGVAGELLIGGRGLGRGYYRSPERTAQRFVLRTGLDGRETRYFRTGDLVRWDARGELEFIDRIDHQVKIRGYRVERGVIEAALRAKTAIRDCAVLARPIDRQKSGNGTNMELAAYIVQPIGEPLDATTLYSSLKDQLPDYMIPTAFLAVDAIPATVNGKVDVARLSNGAGNRLTKSDHLTPGHDEFERIIADMWAAALGIDSIGVHDNFFDLGGHSLLATLVINRLEHRTGIRLSLREIYDSPTVAAMKTALLDRIAVQSVQPHERI
ncbi:MAG TPA: amino acid adenylation domain-containing protein [Streptosporangiaceae bacterium]|nr:amino acid adenylation domain-containing protein [Streptosporangiaceae bacterium]